MDGKKQVIRGKAQMSNITTDTDYKHKKGKTKKIFWMGVVYGQNEHKESPWYLILFLSYAVDVPAEIRCKVLDAT